jgi:hypothetical protein
MAGKTLWMNMLASQDGSWATPAWRDKTDAARDSVGVDRNAEVWMQRSFNDAFAAPPQ